MACHHLSPCSTRYADGALWSKGIPPIDVILISKSKKISHDVVLYIHSMESMESTSSATQGDAQVSGVVPGLDNRGSAMVHDFLYNKVCILSTPICTVHFLYHALIILHPLHFTHSQYGTLPISYPLLIVTYPYRTLCLSYPLYIAPSPHRTLSIMYLTHIRAPYL
jgi:hypothetical protein